MRVSRKNLPKSILELTVEIPAEDAERYFQKALKRLAAGVALPGFRAGKAPVEMAARHIPSRALFDETAQTIVQETYPAALREQKLEPIGKPEIEVLKIARHEAFSYRARIAVLPEVHLADYKKIRVSERSAGIDPKELDDALLYLRKSRADFRNMERGAQKGDLVEIDFAMRRDGVIMEGGSANRQPLILGEGRLVPEFEDALQGMRAGEEKQFQLTFPADYANKNLAGKLVLCEVKMHTVRERILPELTDEFAKSLGKFDTIEELKSSVADGLKKEKEEREKTKTDIELVSQIAQNSKMELPEILIEREVGKMFSELESHLANGGVTLDAYLVHVKRSKTDLAGDWRKEAEKRVKIALVLREIAKRENIHPTQEEIEERANDLLKKYRLAETAEKDIDPEDLREYAEAVLMNERVFEFLHRTCIVQE